MSISEQLSIKDFRNRLSERSNLSNIVFDSEDYELKSACIFDDSKYASVESLRLFSDKTHFNILDLNIQSLRAKFDALTILLNELKTNNIDVSVICCQETWLDDVNDDLNIDGYQTFCLKRTCSLKGGLVTYVRNDFKVKKIVTEYSSCDIYEILSMEVCTACQMIR